MIFVADESVDLQIVTRLRSQYTVIYVAEMNPAMPDDAVLEKANHLGAILITADKDFGELVYQQKRAHNGILLIRLAGLPPQTKAETVHAALTQYGHEMVGNFSVIQPGLIRIRHTLSE